MHHPYSSQKDTDTTAAPCKPHNLLYNHPQHNNLSNWPHLHRRSKFSNIQIHSSELDLQVARRLRRKCSTPVRYPLP